MRVARRFTDLGPAVMVPAAWAVTVGAVATPLVTDRTLLVALAVMDVLLVAFAIAARGKMTGPVLGAWRRVLLGGLAATLVGTAALAVAPDADPLVALPLYAWMVLPGLGYVRTWSAVGATGPRRVYLLSAVLSLAGALLYALASLAGAGVVGLAGLLCVGVGQTAGIVTAAVRNR